MAGRIPLYYTFGNHMHWVDMEWLWGYHVLPGCVRDMLRLCREAGVKGCVNFDGIGYEKLASEDPEAFAELREAIRDGTVEAVGGSYGQPYGLFHGGESNVRQRIYGARVARRLFGVPVRTFWEEEFDFFPQLPQILRGVGIEGASLFFQWTWHTPEVPREDVPVVWWEGQDGSRLLCATRNRLNLHQWPEDMDIVLGELAASPPSSDGPTPLVLQWLELMPSPDWMCRSELILPKLRQLMSDDRFEVRPVTLGGYLRSIGNGTAAPAMVFPIVSDEIEKYQGVPVRRYTLDDVWHGMTLGKNGDNIRRLSLEAENCLLGAETLAAIAGLLGRPYAQWDVYPIWELEEAWRELLSAQHHDIDECEGLCGYVGRFSYERSLALSTRIGRATLRTLVAHVGGTPKGALFQRMWGDFSQQRHGRQSVDGVSAEGGGQLAQKLLFVNSLGWPRLVLRPGAGRDEEGVQIPAFGYAVVETRNEWEMEAGIDPKPTPPELICRDITAVRNIENGGLLQLTSREFPEGAFAEGGAFDCVVTREGVTSAVISSRTTRDEAGVLTRIKSSEREFRTPVYGQPLSRTVSVAYRTSIRKPDPGIAGSLQAIVRPSFEARLIADSAYAVHEMNPIAKGLKKYPTGDWMTSPQWFEEVRRPITSRSFLDLVDRNNPDRGLLIVHEGSKQWFIHEDGSLRCVLNAYDPWDEQYFQRAMRTTFHLVPHGPLTNAQRWKMAQERLRLTHQSAYDGELAEGYAFSALSCDAENVALTAFYRETRDSAKGQEFHAADVMDADYPYVVRLVELDGVATKATLTFGATVARAIVTNLLGEPEFDAEVVDGCKVPLDLRPFEIATLYVDLVEGRKQLRDLDAKREVWATVHRVG